MSNEENTRHIQKRRAIRLALVSFLSLPLGGCILAAVAVAAAVTVGVVKYTENGAEMYFSSNLEDTFAATVAAMRALNYPIAENMVPGPTEGKIAVGDVSVVVARQSEGQTKVTAKVGTFETDDHQRRARIILEETKKRLPGTP